VNLFAFGPESRECADGSAELANQHPSSHFLEPLEITADFIQPLGHLEAKCYGKSLLTVGAASHDCGFMRLGKIRQIA
jgi:hypothetical protein